MDHVPENEALHRACKKGDAAAVEALLRANPLTVFAKAHDGQTALHFAVAYAHAYVARLLIEAGADVNARNRVGLSPLHLGCEIDDPRALVSVLLAHGADVHARDNAAYTPLHYAATRAAKPDAADLLEMLLDAGADVDAQTQKGESALHLASLALQKEDGGEAAVRLLISRGARVDTVDKVGLRAFDHFPVSPAVREMLLPPPPDAMAKPTLKKRTSLRGVGARPSRSRRGPEVDPAEVEEGLHPERA
jgi:hypothetical protein